MKSLKHLLFICLVSSTISSCNKKEEGNPPVSHFKVDVNKFEIGPESQFSDASGFEPTSWYWDFGDGNTSEEQNPTHQYESIGNFSVSLTVKNAYGSNIKTVKNFVEVIAGQKPEAGFKMNQPIVAVFNIISFIDLSINTSVKEIDSWQWDFGDGISSNEQHPIHVFADTGTYNIELKVNNINGESVTSTKLIVYSDYAIDIDSNWYGITKIGNQEWFAQNLKTSKYSNGEEIPHLAKWDYVDDWSTPKSPYYVKLESSNGSDLEWLYNFYAVNEGKLCPEGYHVPTVDDIADLDEWQRTNYWEGTDIKPQINALFSHSDEYWTSRSYGEDQDGSSTFHFGRSGRLSSDYKTSALSIRCLKNK